MSFFFGWNRLLSLSGDDPLELSQQILRDKIVKN
jgi:hypothetical protein